MSCRLRQLLLFAMISILLAAAGDRLSFSQTPCASIAFSSGLYLAVLLLGDKRSWPWWTLVAVVANFAAEMWFEPSSLAVALIGSSARVMGALSVAWLMRRICGWPWYFNTPRNVLLLAFFIAIPGAAVSTGAVFATLLFSGQEATSVAWLIAWTGVVLGTIIVAATVLSAFQDRTELAQMSKLHWLEAGALVLTLTVVLHAVFSSHLPLIYMLMVPLSWAALRFGMFTMALVILLTTAMAMHYTGQGLGPYSLAGSREQSALLVQPFLVVVSITALVFVAITTQRRRIQEALRQAHDELEERVTTRTAALLESEQRLRSLLDAIPDEVRLIDARGRYVMVNRAVREVTGKSNEEIIGKTVFDLRTPEAAASIDAENRQAISTGKSVRIERRSYVHGNWIDVIRVPTLDANGVVTGLVRISRDITESKQVEIALRASEQRLRTLIDAIPDQIRLKDTQGRYIMLNRAALEHLGPSQESVLGKTVFDVRPAEVAARIDAEDRQALAADGPIRIERHSYNNDTWLEIIVAPIRDDTGTVTGMVSISRDITARKQAELDALREREERYRTLVEQASDIIYRTDPQGCFTYFNTDAVTRMAGYAKEDLLGHHYLEFVRPDYREQVEKFYRRQFRERVASSYLEFPSVTKDGRTIWVGQHVQAVIENNRVSYHQAVCRDITERVAAQQALSDTNEQLRRLSARQEELLDAERTRIAHNLHDGVGQSLSLARIKIDTVDVNTGMEMIEDILRDVTHIIDQSATLIRSLEFELSPPVLRELGLAPALDWLAEEMHRGYGLRVAISDDGEHKPLSDLIRSIALRAVRELLINVIKHAGVTSAHVDMQRAANSLIITISDQGCGFDAGQAADGLGLISLRERLTNIGGSMNIYSQPGDGTVVTLAMPLAVA